jgi:hypothetical protein
MITAPYRTAPELERKRHLEDWIFTGMALVMIAISFDARFESTLSSR